MLLDTGPLVAYLDARDQWHPACSRAWPGLADRCITTEAVLAEASHLVSRGGGPAAVALELVLAARIPIASLDERAHRHVALLMARYSDVPMDYADATLVAIAEALGLERVFTTDRRGFGAYRGPGGSAFELLPVSE